MVSLLLITFLFISAFHAIHNNITCKAYAKKCLDDDLEISDLCYVSGNEGIGNETVYTYYYGSCPPGEYCAKVGLKGQCVEAVSLKRYGDACNVGIECESGICQMNRCAYLNDGDVCKEDANCGRRSFCKYDMEASVSKCEKLKQENEQCNFDNYCDYNLACGTIDTSGTKKCARMFSLKPGSLSDNNFLCESGFFASHANLSYCVDVLITRKQCSFNDDNPCPTTYDFGNITTPQDNQFGMCHCKWNGDTVCKPSSNSNLWQHFIRTYTAETSSMKADRVHISTMRSKWWGNSAIMKAYTDYSNYLEMHGAPQCVKKYYYDATLPSDSSYIYNCLLLMLLLLVYI